MVSDKNSSIFLRALFCSPIKYAEKMRMVLRIFSTHFFPSVLVSYFKSTSKSKILGFSLTGQFGAGWFCGLDYYVDSLKLSKAPISWSLLWTRTKTNSVSTCFTFKNLDAFGCFGKVRKKAKSYSKMFRGYQQHSSQPPFYSKCVFKKEIFILSLCVPGLVFSEFWENVNLQNSQ